MANRSRPRRLRDDHGRHLNRFKCYINDLANSQRDRYIEQVSYALQNPAHAAPPSIRDSTAPA
jgi:hypothetical protein